MMIFTTIHTENHVAVLTYERGKVNAINEAAAEELLSRLAELSSDENVKCLIITGKDKFFSFGLDIPEFLNYSKADFVRFVTKFADLYTKLFLFPKPVIAALNGHTVAGGCMLATACDYRIMANGKGKISLNEINFGSSLFPGSAVMLKYCVGDRLSETVAFTGAMFSPEEAKNIGLIDEIVMPEEILTRAMVVAGDYGSRYGKAFESIKRLLRTDTAKRMREKDEELRDEMVEIWYSKETWMRLHNIRIHA